MESIVQPLSSSSGLFANNYSPISMEGSRSLNILTDDDQVYDNYVATTIDPGNKLFIAAIFICVGSILLLPPAVVVGRKRVYAKREANSQVQNVGSRDEISEGRGNEPPHPWYVKILHFLVDSLVMWRHAHHETHLQHGLENEARASVPNIDPSTIPQNIDLDNTGDVDHTVEGEEKKHDLIDLGSGSDDVLNTCDDHEKKDELNTSFDEEGNENVRVSVEAFEMEPNNASGNSSNQGTVISSTRRQRARKVVAFTLELGKYDNESKRILRLAIPFMTNNLIKTIADLACLAVISQYLGTDPMIAYAMVEVIVGVSSAFMMGWIETVNSLGAMAQGAENLELVGQYLQIAIIVYVICQIPTALIWGFSMHKIILLFGFSETAATIAGQYVWCYMADQIMFGIFQSFIDFLGLIDREQLGMVFSCSRDLGKIALVVIVLKSTENATLTIVGLAVLANTCLWVFLTIAISSHKKLTRPYEYGMIGELSLRNKRIVKALLKTGLPLAVGGLLAYAEWEVLTIFAAILGPAEAATWAILGFVWDVFESTTEAIGDASEVRCAYQLGKGRPEMAKISAYKSMLLSIVMASIITTVFLCLGGQLPGWLTTDETIQGLLVELFPLMGLGNLTFTVGMVCWALIGAQARYDLATTINLATSMLITIPLGAIMTVLLNIDLQGLTFSIVMGYVACAWIMVIVILISDWDALSKQIRERVAAGDLDIESCSTDGSGLYGAYDWKELPDDVRAAAELLGYTKFLWDHDKEPEEAEKDWAELTPEQQEAATLLGYDETKWDDAANSGSNYNHVSPHDDDVEGPQKRYLDSLSPEGTQDTVSYDHLDWEDLPADVQAAAGKLGYNEDFWDDDEDPDESDKDWDELTEEQRDAARILGYDEDKWNSD